MKKIFILFLLLFFSTKVFSEIKYISLKNGARGIIYLPKKYSKYKRYPLLIALHGKKETSEMSLQRYKNIADELNMILLCPRASSFARSYIRTPVDDRARISKLRDYVVKHYKIKKRKTIISGFSKGGHIGVEIGLIYPAKFKKIISMFGFFNSRHKLMASQNIKKYKRSYNKSNFYFITGQGDLSHKAAVNGYQTLKSLGIKTRLKVYKTLLHKIPPDLGREIRAFLKA